VATLLNTSTDSNIFDFLDSKCVNFCLNIARPQEGQPDPASSAAGKRQSTREKAPFSSFLFSTFQWQQRMAAFPKVRALFA
jgi:hypothetical protein